MSDSHRDIFQEIWRMFQDDHFQSGKAEYFPYENYIVKDLLSYVVVVEQYILFYCHLEITYLNTIIHIGY